MISAANLEFAYADAPPALQDLTFALTAGSITCLAGRNGSGKSTLLGLMAGLYPPTRGVLHLAGHQSPGDERALRSRARLVLQEADLQCLGATVGEDLLLGTDDLAAARTLAARMGLAALWDAPIHTLSHGQKRKCAIAAALLATPDVLLLDEPLSGLDHPAVLELRAIIQENQTAGMTQVISTHDLEPVLDLCDHVLALEAGRLVCFDTPAAALPRLAAMGLRPPCSWRFAGRVEPYV
ncbi:energy-coupling factor ABC transporter ATP-binding protein [Megalodesulfovibrio gigas]|uniref:Putative ABC transporter-like protein n=1 Tax=Megalodesulfovibrio gigas (strain ATCC 19364 / DSM 1382 / NCIMB 9332 / VKM B-1759) TaxID=1121448 RepID=T2G8U9_MEGG1|nr:ABC transporter ATP-binding protein [Megalodesulfovibrio gigas]AGW12337.1 putative ABC transporter-like protein [Megalodesulfovibrio gigas DSM 1382 = ATCC 19364]